MSHGWDAALDAQTDLRHSFKTDEGSRYMAGFAETLETNSKRVDESGSLVAMRRDDARHLIFNAIATVNRGDPVWVAEDVVELVQHASETFNPEPVYLDDLFIPDGFALFERPLSILDINGKMLSFRAASWAVATTAPDGTDGGMTIALWSHVTDKDDFTAKELMGRVGGSDLILGHVDSLLFGSDTILTEPTNRGLMKLLQVLWRLAQQQIVIPATERASRPTWKRAAWRQIKDVTVLTLRKVRGTRYDGDERDVEWSHRWMVSGHWRNQPYRIEGETVHRQIWIAPYVKGPDDKPLVLKRRVVEFVR